MKQKNETTLIPVIDDLKKTKLFPSTNL